jgi:hypothetical protein
MLEVPRESRSFAPTGFIGGAATDQLVRQVGELDALESVDPYQEFGFALSIIAVLFQHCWRLVEQRHNYACWAMSRDTQSLRDF